MTMTLRLVKILLAVAGGVITCFLLVVGVVWAQTAPGAPTSVAAYSIATGDLEVRWSSSDFASTTSFKVQWKSGSQEYDSSRQDEVTDLATSTVPASSSETTRRYKHTITGLTDGTEYTVRVIATNTEGDSNPSPEATGTPQSTPGHVRAFIENEVVKIHESAFPWLRETWAYITSQNVAVEFQEGTSDFGVVVTQCSLFFDLDVCRASLVSVVRGGPRLIYTITHELGHVYTLSNNVTNQSAPLGIAHVYFSELNLQGSYCNPSELYADILTVLVHGDLARQQSSYWSRCPGTNDSLTEEALAVVTSVAAGEMPSWFADTYHDTDGEPDLEQLWEDVKAIEWADAVVFQLRNAFGGYCDNQKAAESAFGDGVTRNPWRDGGCVPEAPGDPTATAIGSGNLRVTWAAPEYDGGSPIEGYRVQWKSGTQDYDPSRQADVTNLSHTIPGLTNGVEYTVQVLAYNHNGDGAISAEETARAVDTSVPYIESVIAGDGSLTVVWTAPTSVSGITAYDLRYIKTSDDETDDANWTVKEDVWTSGAGSLEYTITGLENGVGYDVQVRAVASGSDGGWSPTSTGAPADHGGNRSSATEMGLNTSVIGYIDSASDNDYFKIVLPETSGIFAYTTSYISGFLPTNGELQNSFGSVIKTDDDDDQFRQYGPQLFLWDTLEAGTYYIRVSAPETGAYTLHTQTIRDTTGTGDAADLPLNGFATGILDPGADDGDYFKIEVSQETDLMIRVTRADDSLDTEGALLDSSGAEVAVHDDSFLIGNLREQFLIRKKLEAGVYYLRVRDAPGRSYRTCWGATPEFYLGVWTDCPTEESQKRKVGNPGPYAVSAEVVTPPGSSTSRARHLTLGEDALAGGRIDTAGNADYFSITVTETTYMRVQVVSASVETDGVLLDSGGREKEVKLSERDYVPGGLGFVLYGTLDAGTSYIKVTAGDSTLRPGLTP